VNPLTHKIVPLNKKEQFRARKAAERQAEALRQGIDASVNAAVANARKRKRDAVYLHLLTSTLVRTDVAQAVANAKRALEHLEQEAPTLFSVEGIAEVTVVPHEKG
jgi:hypothetical protein